MASLEQILKKIVRRINSKKFTVDANIKKISHNVEAYINIENWRVNVSIDKNILDTLKKLPKNSFKSKDILFDMIYAVTNHEFGHNSSPEGFFGCPGDEEYFRKTIEGIRDALDEFGVPEDGKDQVAHHIANLFEDYIVNSSYALRDKKKESFRNGISAFYFLNALNNEGMDKAFGAFVDIQMKTYWDKKEVREFAEKMTRDYDPKLSKDLIQIFTDNEELTDKIMNNALTEDDKLKLYDELNEKEKWNLKAYQFTKRLYEFMKNQNQCQQCGGSCSSGGGGQGSSGQDKSGQSQSQESQDKGNNYQGKQKQGKSEGDKQKSGGKSSNESEDGSEDEGIDQQGNEEQEENQQPENNPTGPMLPQNNVFTDKYQNDKEFRDKINGKPEKSQKGQSNPGNQGPPIIFPFGELPQEGKMSSPPRIKGGVGKGAGRGSGSFLPGISRGPGEVFTVPDDFIDYIKGVRPDLDINSLYQFFESLAEELTIVGKKEGDDEETQKLPIVHAHRKRIDDFVGASLGDIDWESTLYMPGGDWNFFAKQSPITVDEEAQPEFGSSHDLCFIGDVSGSMGFAAPLLAMGYDIPRENLQGHDAFCTMVHSIVKDLKKKKIAYHLKYSSILFSDQTNFSGWNSYYDINKLFAFMYTGYEGGGTSFDANVLREMYRESTDKFLTIMLSDGEITNWQQAASIVGGIIKQGNEFVLIEYGGGHYGDGEGRLTEFGRVVKSMGGDVHTISNINDLFKITLKKTRGMY